MNFIRAIIAGCITWITGVTLYTISLYTPIMENMELQNNLVLILGIIPCAILGAHFYYRNLNETNGFKLGIIMFSVAIVLDAVITVPVFIIPEGGNYITFFGDFMFWLIGIEYVLVVGVFSRFSLKNKLQNQA